MAFNNNYEKKLFANGLWKPLSDLLSSTTDPDKIATHGEINAILGSGPATTGVTNMASLIAASTTTPLRINGYHTAGDGGDGVFLWVSSTPKTSHNGGTIIDPGRTFPTDWTNETQKQTWFTAAGSGSGCWVRIGASQTINIKIFGCRDGYSHDSTIPLQTAINSVGAFGSLYVPSGTYKATGITLTEGITIEGNGRSSVITHLSALGDMMVFSPPLSSGRNWYGPKIKNLLLNAYNCIRINTQVATLTGGQAAVMGSLFENVHFENSTNTRNGVALNATMLFDSIIARCYFEYNFNYHIDFYGCDLNTIQNNRLHGAAVSLIRTRRQGTFGSTNLIDHNDLLQPILGATSFIESTDGYVKIFHNYFERDHVQATPITAAILIDTESPTSNGQTIEIVGNRLDVFTADADAWLRIKSTPNTINLYDNTMLGNSRPPLVLDKDLTYFSSTSPITRRNIFADSQAESVVPFITKYGKNIPNSGYAFYATPSTSGLDTGLYGPTVVCKDGAFVLPSASGGNWLEFRPDIYQHAIDSLCTIKIIAKSITDGKSLAHQYLNTTTVANTGSVILSTTKKTYTLFRNISPTNLRIKLGNGNTDMTSDVYIYAVIVEYSNQKSGTSTQSGNSSATVFNIAHGLGLAPVNFNIIPQSAVAAAPYYVTVDATNIIITFPTAPATGTNNLVWKWTAEL